MAKSNRSLLMSRRNFYLLSGVVLVVLIVAAYIFFSSLGDVDTGAKEIDCQNEQSELPNENEKQFDADQENKIIELDNDGTIKITGFEPMTDSICLSIRLEEVPAYKLDPGFDQAPDQSAAQEKLEEKLKQIHLVDQQGNEYRYQGGNFAAENQYHTNNDGETTWSSELLLELPELHESAESVILVVPLAEEHELKEEMALEDLISIGECRIPGLRITW